jgi:hypothetical protein
MNAVILGQTVGNISRKLQNHAWNAWIINIFE